MSSQIQITAAQLIVSLIGAAGIGALTSSIHAYRTASRTTIPNQGALLSQSINMAQKTTDLMFKIGKEMGGGQVFPEIVTARWYHRQLSLLLTTGKIDEHLEKEFGDYIMRSHVELDKKQRQPSS